VFLRARTAKGRTYLYIVENRRVGRRVEQHTLAHLGRRDAMDPFLIRELATAMAEGDSGLRRFVQKMSGTPRPVGPGVHLVEDQVDLEESNEK
jgi:hypothetical protein